MDEFNRLTAQDLRHHEFSRKLRGYDKAEVDEMLSRLADRLEQDAAEKTEFARKIEMLENRLREFRELETTLKNTLVRSQESIDDLRRSAQKESELIIREAQVKADRLIEEKQARIRQLESRYAELQQKWDEYFIKFKSLLTTHLEMLEQIGAEYNNPARPEAKSSS